MSLTRLHPPTLMHLLCLENGEKRKIQNTEIMFPDRYIVNIELLILNSLKYLVYKFYLLQRYSYLLKNINQYIITSFTY